MPISPEECRQHRLKLAAPEAEKLYEKIDQRLKSDEPPVLIAVGQLKPDVVKNIATAYYKKLWNVTYKDNNLQFTERREIHYLGYKD